MDQGRGKFVQETLKNVENANEDKKEDDSKGGVKLKKIGGGMKKTSDSTAPTTANTSKGGEATTPTVNTLISQESSVGDVEVIQKLIQSLTQNTNPLKRSIDFVNDDIESMNKEMEYWRNQYLASKGKYQIELKNTEEALQPLQNKYAEIDEQIKERKLRIQNVKAQILQNEQRIQNLLYSVVTTK